MCQEFCTRGGEVHLGRYPPGQVHLPGRNPLGRYTPLGSYTSLGRYTLPRQVHPLGKYTSWAGTPLPWADTPHWAGTPLGRYTPCTGTPTWAGTLPWADTHILWQVPPWASTPPPHGQWVGYTPWAGTPPGQLHPPWSMSGRYASYWNAFLFHLGQTQVKSKRENQQTQDSMLLSSAIIPNHPGKIFIVWNKGKIDGIALSEHVCHYSTKNLNAVMNKETLVCEKNCINVFYALKKRKTLHKSEIKNPSLPEMSICCWHKILCSYCWKLQISVHPDCESYHANNMVGIQLFIRLGTKYSELYALGDMCRMHLGIVLTTHIKRSVECM